MGVLWFKSPLTDIIDQRIDELTNLAQIPGFPNVLKSYVHRSETVREELNGFSVVFCLFSYFDKENEYNNLLSEESFYSVHIGEMTYEQTDDAQLAERILNDVKAVLTTRRNWLLSMLELQKDSNIVMASDVNQMPFSVQREVLSRIDNNANSIGFYCVFFSRCYSRGPSACYVMVRSLTWGHCHVIVPMAAWANLQGSLPPEMLKKIGVSRISHDTALAVGIPYRTTDPKIVIPGLLGLGNV